MQTSPGNSFSSAGTVKPYDDNNYKFRFGSINEDFKLTIHVIEWPTSSSWASNKPVYKKIIYTGCYIAHRLGILQNSGTHTIFGILSYSGPEIFTV